MKGPNPSGVGFGGDGDEIAAIENVEACFGVKLDYRDAAKWLTAGDVYRTLCKALPAEEAEKPGTWNRFVEALVHEGSADPRTIKPESLLLGPAAGSTTTVVVTAIIAAAVIVGGLFLIRFFRA